MTRRSEVQLLALARMVENLAHVYPDAITALWQQESAIDGYPAGSDSPKVSRTSELTPTEAAAEQRLHFGRRRAELETEYRALVAIVHNMINLAWEAMRLTAVTTEAPRRCDPNGREGHLEWGDFTCDALPVAHGLCSPCYQRERRWRVAHGLPTREAA